MPGSAAPAGCRCRLTCSRRAGTRRLEHSSSCPALLSRLSFPGSPFPALLFLLARLFFSSCPALLFLLARLFFSSCPALLSRLSFPGSPFPALLSRLFFPGGTADSHCMQSFSGSIRRPGAWVLLSRLIRMMREKGCEFQSCVWLKGGLFVIWLFPGWHAWPQWQRRSHQCHRWPNRR